MAWRFKASKYKNSAPVVPKPENYVRDICVGSYQNYGNNIAASAKFMAFNWDHAGSSLAVLPVDDSGRKSKLMPLLHAHSDTVTDLDFSPFHDGLLATGSQDCLVKIWSIPEDGLQESLRNPECVFSHKQRRVETVGFHPTADFLLHSTSFTTITLWDLISEQEIFSNAKHAEVIQSVSWKRDGTLMVTSCKDKMIRILDPRAMAEEVCLKIANSHQSIKDSRVIWLGDNNKVLSTGFDAQRLRQIIIRDLRNFSEPEKSLELDCSTGILIPLYDADTGMLFLAGKGDSTIGFMEVTDKEPYLIEGIRHSGEQTKGACLVPKRALNVMQGEVNRILQLTSSSVIPITYQVPRKTYRDFHADLYPDTPGYKTELTAAQWIKGKNVPLKKICLDPAKRENGDQPIIPRLGPKPFTPAKINDHESCFDKVFSVPCAPGQINHTNGIVDKSNAMIKTSMNQIDLSPNLNNVINDNKNEEPSEKVQDCKVIDNINLVSNSDKNGNDENDCELDLSKTSTTVTHRKIFENLSNSKEQDDDDVYLSDENNFERASLQRTSIAERRKMYENRSQTMQEPPTIIAATEKTINNGSPVFLRKNSLKNLKKNEDENKLIVTKQMSLDQSLKKIDGSSSTTPKRTSTVFGRVSKFRHLKGTPAHKSFFIENIKNISRQIPGECDGFHANCERAAVPLSGPGGKIAVFELNKTGKLPDGIIPTLVNGVNIMDFCWDIFDNHRLAVACDDGTIKLWTIPENGLLEPTNEPQTVFNAHSDKIYFIKFHPLAKDVLASGSYDMTVKIWDLNKLEEKIILKGHTEQIFCFAWSPCGNFCSTISKDCKIRIYKPRNNNTLPIKEGKGPVGSRGARIIWAIEGNYLVVMGFDKASERQIIVYKTTDLNNPLNTIGLDVSPAILIPFYDEDSSTLFVTGKGDSTIYCFEITEESPYICALSHHRCNNLHQGLSFLPKNVCDVANVEFAKALRLTNNTIEPLSFTVPRIKTDLFQDDLFPPTKITWLPCLLSSEWFNGKNKEPSRISLKPEGMDILSENAGQANTNNEKTINKSDLTNLINPSQTSNRFSAWNVDLVKNQTKLMEEEIKKSLSNRVEINLKLEQDEMEGVDEKEWYD